MSQDFIGIREQYFLLLNHVNREQFRNCENKTLLFEKAFLLKYAPTVIRSAIHSYEFEFLFLSAHTNLIN